MKRTLFSVVLLVLIAGVSAFAQLSGAVFATDSTGTTVNGNIYILKTDVYLTGGPQNKCGSAGLPDGIYAFQVTDPSGGVLLSTDDIVNRQITVVNGIVVSYSGPHAIGAGKCGGISVQLMPYDDTPNPGEEYKVWVTPYALYSPGAGNFGFVNNVSKTDNFKIKEPVPTDIAITGFKYYDANLNGVQDSNEPTIPGWQIAFRQPPDFSAITFTNASGQYSFLVPPNSGIYKVLEVMPSPLWVNTTPISSTVSAGSADIAGPDFGNVCLGPGGGLTLGFWSNKNGKALTSSGDLGLLKGLPLVKGDGNPYDPATATDLSAWLLSGNAVNMANMLSVQLAAMELNVQHGFVLASTKIYAPGVPNATQYGFISISDLMSAAVVALVANPTTYSGSLARTSQETLKNALDAANNNKNFVQPKMCGFSSPY